MFNTIALNNTIRYISTNGHPEAVSFSHALMAGLAPDKGLYIPDHFPELDHDELNSFAGIGYHDIAAHVTGKFMGDEMSYTALHSICHDAYNFDVPLEEISEGKFILRLDQGPTASFKDFAARLMSRLMQHFLSSDNRKLTILTATSGDTGSAVANAFYGLKNIKVIILFPLDEVTEIQRKQMTTLKGNIKVIAVNGKFDDCQHMVKQAFTDPELRTFGLSSANSINIGRLIPQTIYYIYAWSRVATHSRNRVVFSVPSGNFGNVTAGLIAKRMGLPVDHFVISTNENDEFPEFMKSGIYKPVVPSRNCISSAMNVGHPSNLARIISMYGGRMDEKGHISVQADLPLMKSDMTGIKISDEETRRTIFNEYLNRQLLLEPHGAVAWAGLNEYINSHSEVKNVQYISLETAHPAKFSHELRKVINTEPPLPVSMERLLGKQESYLSMENNYGSLKELLISENSD